jgi:hypothetical protein
MMVADAGTDPVSEGDPMYRSHLIVFDPTTGKRLSPEAVLKTTRLGYAYPVSRLGVRGFRVEARTRADFRYKLLSTLRLLAADCGYIVEARASSIPAHEASVSLAGSTPRGVSFARG